MVLFINACARPQSRTLALAKEAVKAILDKCEILNLYEENIKPLNYDNLLLRDEAVKNADFSDTMFSFAKQFSNADEIIVATPYWDLSFPAILKCYIESICVNGITFIYNEHGIPQGLCKAKRLTFITTAGGFIPDNNYGYNYVKQLCNDLFGITNTVCIKAEGLDIQGSDEDRIIKSAQDEIRIEFSSSV